LIFIQKKDFSEEKKKIKNEKLKVRFHLASIICLCLTFDKQQE